ncbi:MAG TPA: alpha/beta hydrolase-fold protein [Chthonomonadaceae bacterium]|nr:alpha/beta hydrolase-fold protein [Chthonomonadaceae bacterium]
MERGPNVPAGKLTSQEIYSSILDDERDFTLYVPASYREKGPPSGLLVIFDGQNNTRLIPAPAILDNLIAQGRIPPLIAVMVASNGKHRTISRTSDLTCNPDFADFIVKELVPWVRARYNVTTAPNHAIVCGESLGGLEATYIGFRYPDVFGNVLSFSGSFFYFLGWPAIEANYTTQTGWLTTQFATTPRKPLRLYLTTGTFEGDGLTENRRMRDVLIARGYPITYSEYNGGHDQFCWRGLLASGLLALVGDHVHSARRLSATRAR